MIFSSEPSEPPAISIAGFHLWIHGRQYPDASDYWDANWLRVTAQCSSAGASVTVAGPVLMTTDVQRFADQCEALYARLSGSALLDSCEPNLRVLLSTADSLGHLELKVEITPDQLQQEHRFSFEVDQTYLPALIAKCRAVVKMHPIIGDGAYPRA
jgi:hypothetical protein